MSSHEQEPSVVSPVADLAEAADPGANLRRQVLLPLLLVFMLLAVAFAYSTYRSERTFNLEAAEQQLSTINKALENTLELRGRRLLRALEFIDDSPLLREVLASGDRGRMMESFEGMFGRLRQRFDISHFYFIGPDRTVLLRLHQPDRHGDRLERTTILEAERTGSAFVGLELGPMGTLSLRAVKPIHVGNTLLGYVELSEEVLSTVQEVISLSGGEGLIVLHKEGLARPDWEAGMRMLGREPDWERLPGSVVTYSSLPQIPVALDRLLPEGAHPRFKSAGEIMAGERVFQAGFVPLFDVNKREVADLVILHDVTTTAIHMRQSLMTMVGIALMLGLLLVGLFGLILGRVQRTLVDSRMRLIDYLARHKLAEAEIEQLAYYDHLTRLPNRRLLHDRIKRALAVTARDGHHGAVLLIDLDHFNLLNDTRGHEVGDRLLLEVASRLPTCVRECDTVAHLGGDEFVILVEGLGRERAAAATQVEVIGEKIRTALARPIALDVGDDNYHCTASIGAELFAGGESTVDALLQHADAAMYQAKDAGRDALYFFDPAMQAVLEAHATLSADLRRALDLGQFVLHYQPQVDQNGAPLGAEALLRWTHPERGMVSPADFIPLAEQTGLIVPIGQWVLETACQRLAQWQQDDATRDLLLAVNVSARQFRQPNFVSQVQAVLERSGAMPSRLKLELTESVVLDDIASTIERMNALRALGVGFSMDDFGTGYSSLSYLKRLPLDQVKIDRSFVRDIATDSGDAAIVRTIIAMAGSLDLAVIAEGVETQEQLDFLVRYGCPLFQGYLFARPLPPDAFEAFLSSAPQTLRDTQP